MRLSMQWQHRGCWHSLERKSTRLPCILLGQRYMCLNIFCYSQMYQLGRVQGYILFRGTSGEFIVAVIIN